MVLNQQHDRVRGENWDWDCPGHRPGTGWEAARAASVWVRNGVVVGHHRHKEDDDDDLIVV